MLVNKWAVYILLECGLASCKNNKRLITDCIRSMGEGTVFTGVCHSLCPQGQPPPHEVDTLQGPGGRHPPPRTRSQTPPPPPKDQGVDIPLPGGRSSIPPQPIREYRIQSVRDRYASYWNVFLLFVFFCPFTTKSSHFCVKKLSNSQCQIKQVCSPVGCVPPAH